MLKGQMQYDWDRDRLTLCGHDLHCGDALEVYDALKGQWIPTRLEMSANNVWYLYGTSYRDYKLLDVDVRINGTPSREVYYE